MIIQPIREGCYIFYYYSQIYHIWDHLFMLSIKISNYGDLSYCKIEDYFILRLNLRINDDLLNDSDLGQKKAYIFLIINKQSDIYNILCEHFQNYNLAKTKYLIFFVYNQIATRNIEYKKFISLFLISFIYAFIQLDIWFYLLNNILYLLNNSLKFYLAIFVLLGKKDIYSFTQCASYSNFLPVYSVLIPVYKEEKKIYSIINSVDNLLYPRSQLEIKIIVENDDIATISLLSRINLPGYIEVIKVPYCLPRTKPKALNYAMNYIKGSYLVIYDAEDEPDKEQLIKAVARFAHLPESCAALQASLNFYNSNENLLTALFSIEYMLWFEYFLKALSLSNLPVPLGGTSNHIKVSVLRKLGGFDSYNVTEDAELGLRLYISGYRVHMLNSYTMEEAPNNILVWLKQRSRWIKGFMQTFLLVIMQNKFREISLYAMFVTFIFIGLVHYYFFCWPFFLLSPFNKVPLLLKYFFNINCFFSLFYLYFHAIIASISFRKKIFINSLSLFRLFFTIFLFPFYFILHMIASYIALFEIFFKPFSWNKTPHGLSKSN